MSMVGLGNHGKRTVAGVVPLSTLSYRSLSRATSAGSFAISAHDRQRTVVWNASCIQHVRKGGEHATEREKYAHG
jgi:hypothetical protein